MVSPPPGVSSAVSVPPMASVKPAGHRQPEPDARRPVAVAGSPRQPLERGEQPSRCRRAGTPGRCRRRAARPGRRGRWRAATDRRAGRRGAARCPPRWRPPAPAGRGRRARRAAARRSSIRDPVGAGDPGQGPHGDLGVADRREQRGDRARRRAGTSRAGCPTSAVEPVGRLLDGGQSARPVRRRTARRSGSRRLPTAALIEVSGLRRSCPTAESSALRVSVASARRRAPRAARPRPAGCAAPAAPGRRRPRAAAGRRRAAPGRCRPGAGRARRRRRRRPRPVSGAVRAGPDAATRPAARTVDRSSSGDASSARTPRGPSPAAGAAGRCG